MARFAGRLPAQIAFAPELCRQESWGRMEELSASGAVLSSLDELKRGERLFLSFELGRERFSGLLCEVSWVGRDEDGFSRAELRFLDELNKRELARALLDVLSSGG